VGGPYNNSKNWYIEPVRGVTGDADGVITGRFINITYTITTTQYIYVCVCLYSTYI